jgi:hypothetical protein
MKHIATILAVLALIAAGALGYLFFDTKNQLADTANQLDASRQAEAATQSQLDSANENIHSLKKDLESERTSLSQTRNQLSKANSQLAMEKQKGNRLSKQLADAGRKANNLEEQNGSLSRQLSAIRRQVSALESSTAQIKQMEQQLVALRESNNEMQQIMLAKADVATASNSFADEAPTTTDAYSFNTRPAVLPASLGPEITILTTQARDGMLVLEASAEAALEAGSEITLVKGFKALAKIRIIESNGNELLAHILPDPAPSSLSDGSMVQFLR